MPTIKDKIRFNYDGVWSDHFGVINVVTESGMFDESFVATRSIIETDAKRGYKPYLNGVQEAPLEFDMIIAFEDGYDKRKIDEVVRWLFVDYYKPLYFERAENRVFYCMPNGDSSIVHTGFEKGYFKISMRCDAPYTYSPSTKTDEYDLSDGENQIINIRNDGHYISYPEISITKVEDGDITIVSNSDGGSIFDIHNLTNAEGIYINCEKEIIESDIVGIYRYGDIVGEFPRILIGNNNFTVSGKCKIQFRYRNKYKF